MKKRHAKKIIRQVEKQLSKSLNNFLNHFEANSNNEYILPFAYDRDYPTLRARFDKGAKPKTAPPRNRAINF